LSVLFKSRQPSMANEEAARLAEDWNEDLEKMEVRYPYVFMVMLYRYLPTNVGGTVLAKFKCFYIYKIWVRAKAETRRER